MKKIHLIYVLILISHVTLVFSDQSDPFELPLLIDLSQIDLKVIGTEVVDSVSAWEGTYTAKDGYKLVIVTMEGYVPKECRIAYATKEFTAIYEKETINDKGEKVLECKIFPCIAAPYIPGGLWIVGDYITTEFYYEPSQLTIKALFGLPIDIDRFFVRYPALMSGKADLNQTSKAQNLTNQDIHDNIYIENYSNINAVSVQSISNFTSTAQLNIHDDFNYPKLLIEKENNESKKNVELKPSILLSQDPYELPLLMDFSQLDLEMINAEVVDSISAWGGKTYGAEDGYKLVIVTMEGYVPKACRIAYSTTEFNAIYEKETINDKGEGELKVRIPHSVAIFSLSYWLVGDWVNINYYYNPSTFNLKLAFCIPEDIYSFHMRYPALCHEINVYAEETNITLPYEFTLNQNYPNPFNSVTTIEYSFPEGKSELAKLKIYDLRGALVKTLVDQIVKSGNHSIMWDGTDENGIAVSSGIYIYSFEAGKFSQSKKMLFIK